MHLKTMIAGIVSAVAVAAGTVYGEQPEALTARISDGGAERTVSLRDGEIQFRMPFGTVTLALHDVRRINRPAGEARVRVETTAGDVWLVSKLSGRLLAPEGATPFSLPLQPLTLDSLEVFSTNPPLARVDGVRVWLTEDQQRVWCATSDWSLDLRTDRGHQRLPVASIAQLAALDSGYRPSGQPIADTWRLTFPGGFAAVLRNVLAAQTIPVIDAYGNHLQIPMRVVGRLERSTESSPAPKTDDAARRRPTPNGPQLAHVDLATGADLTGELPFTVWEVGSSLGTIPVPSPLIARISPAARAGQVELTTVYGERFTGAILPASITLGMDPDAGPHQVVVATSRIAPLQAPTLDLPAGWLGWNLISGDQVAARLNGESVRLQLPGTPDPVELPITSIRSIQNLGRLLAIEDDHGALYHARLPKDTARVTLLTSGASEKLAWKQVRSAASAFGAAAENPPANSPPVLDGMTLVRGGLFLMGRTKGTGPADELPPHALTLPDFYLDPQEITRAQFADFAEATGYKTDAEMAGGSSTWKAPGFRQRFDEPVVCVSWRDAARFCNWRSEAAGLKPCYEFPRRDEGIVTKPQANGYRLPTEAEWEHAARSGGDRAYPWGDAPVPEAAPMRANFRQAPDQPADGWLWTNPVRAFPPNALGLYGMAGNVWEWCEDWYFDQAYTSIHRQKPDDPCVRTGDVADVTRRVMRGGSFDSDLEMLRCASRANGLPAASVNRVGFRCARTAAAPKTP